MSERHYCEACGTPEPTDATTFTAAQVKERERAAAEAMRLACLAKCETAAAAHREYQNNILLSGDIRLWHEHAAGQSSGDAASIRALSGTGPELLKAYVARAIEAAIKPLRETLKWYADQKSWHSRAYGGIGISSDARIDNGDKARVALAKFQEER